MQLWLGNKFTAVLGEGKGLKCLGCRRKNVNGFQQESILVRIWVDCDNSLCAQSDDTIFFLSMSQVQVKPSEWLADNYTDNALKS